MEVSLHNWTCLETGNKLHYFFQLTQLCILSSVCPFSSLMLKVLTQVSLYQLLWIKDFHFMFQRHAFAFWKTMPLNIFNLTCNSFFKKKKIPFSTKATFIFTKGDKTPLPSLHFLLSCSVILRSFSSLSLSSFPQLSAASSPSRHSPHRAAGKDPFAELSLEDFL